MFLLYLLQVTRAAALVFVEVLTIGVAKWEGLVSWGLEENIHSVLWLLKERSHLEDLDTYSIIILKLILRSKLYGADWIYLAENTDRRWTVVNTVMNIRVPYNMGNFVTR